MPTRLIAGASILKRIIADKGNRGRGMPSPHTMRVLVYAQWHDVKLSINRELNRRSAVEPVIGHLKSDHRMGRKFLIGTEGANTSTNIGVTGANSPRSGAVAAFFQARP